MSNLKSAIGGLVVGYDNDIAKKHARAADKIESQREESLYVEMIMLACKNTKKYNVFGGTNMFILGCIVAFPIAVLVTLVKMNK